MRTFAIYDRESGRIVAHYSGSVGQLLHNVPAGCSAVQGRHDASHERIDDETGTASDWKPPQPSPDHEWSQDRRGWRLTSEAVRKRTALREIRRLERDEQPRAVREAALGMGTDRLQQIEERIKALRSQS